jgi:hypothetical protein
MTTVYFPREGYDFSASLIKGTNSMSACVNNHMGTNFTPQTTLYEVIRAVLQLNYCIAYINVGVRSWSLQSFARNTLADYVSKPIDISGVTKQ